MGEFLFKYKWDAENAENADVLLLISENQRFSASKLNSGLIMFDNVVARDGGRVVARDRRATYRDPAEAIS